MSQNGLRFTLDVDGLTPTATAVGVNPSSGINSSTGASWNQNERLKILDEASNDSIKSGHFITILKAILVLLVGESVRTLPS
ncbi:hypothetical protein LE270_02145 [Salmonella enterica subsp. enterica serovar Hillegersberg]|uniref:hypothetical protein n=1 Tax=Salmonella enterica TaxID=28901 RepID=UPI001D0675A4|nr:hypothetical protein [Salmonella enterica]MCB7130881.1 hypothetical protein [Salmonella enterica subsp. enterica serovar Hillegersberg]